MRIQTMLPALGVAAAALLPAAARAQRLGPFRQFLAVEPYYVRSQYDPGRPTEERLSADGFGARLWLNVAPFSKGRPLSYTSVSLFAHGSPKKDGWGTLHYGASVDQFITHRPFAGFLDPLVSFGVGGYQARTDVFVRNAAGARVFGATDKRTRLALTPGLGLRVPIPDRFEFRVDARRAYPLNAQGSAQGRRAISHNEFTAAFGLTF